jgi:hypothetical protein
MQYCVFVDDNFHYQDDSERYAHGVFDTADEAIATCQKIVDDSLRHLYGQHPGTAERLYDDYQDFGDDPFIRSDDPSCKFSGWGYAKHRANHIVAEFKADYE